MDKLYVVFTFLLANGNTKLITVNDIREDVTNSELIALANLFIQKSSQYKGSEFTSLQKCEKFALKVEEVS